MRFADKLPSSQQLAPYLPSQLGQIFDIRGTKRGEQTGNATVKVGSSLETVGKYTAQPEITAVGQGVRIAGEFEKGENVGAEVGELIGEKVGLGGLGKKLGAFLGSENKNVAAKEDRKTKSQLREEARLEQGRKGVEKQRLFDEALAIKRANRKTPIIRYRRNNGKSIKHKSIKNISGLR